MDQPSPEPWDVRTPVLTHSGGAPVNGAIRHAEQLRRRPALASVDGGEPAPAGADPVVRPIAQLILIGAALIVCLGAVLGNPIIALAGVGLALGLVASLRFEALVLAALFIRAALDATKANSALAPATALAALFLAALAVRELMARSTGERQHPIRAPFTLPLIALLGVSVFSGALSNDPPGSLTESVRLAGVVGMVLALERVLHGTGATRRVLIAVFASSLLPMALGVWQLLGHGKRQIGDYSRVEGTFLHPNPFSIYLAVLICMAVALLPHVSVRVRWLLLAGIGLAGLLLLGTYTRGSWIALVLGLLVVGLIQSRWLVGAVVAGAVASLIFVPSVSARFSDLGTATRYSGTPGNSLVWRVDYWQQAIALNQGTPLLGIGLKGIERSTEDAKNAHNDVVRMFVELGLAGLGVYLWLAVTLVMAARRALRATSGRNLNRGIAVGFAGCLAIVALVSLSSNVITQVVLLWYIGTLAMLAVFTDLPGAGADEPATRSRSLRDGVSARLTSRARE